MSPLHMFDDLASPFYSHLKTITAKKKTTHPEHRTQAGSQCQHWTGAKPRVGQDNWVTDGHRQRGREEEVPCATMLTCIIMKSAVRNITLQWQNEHFTTGSKYCSSVIKINENALPASLFANIIKQKIIGNILSKSVGWIQKGEGKKYIQICLSGQNVMTKKITKTA